MRNVTISTIAGGVLASTIGLLQAFGVQLTAEQSQAITAAFGAWMLLAAYLYQRYAVAKEKVVEQTPDGKVVIAGKANELPTGTLIRDDLGERDE